MFQSSNHGINERKCAIIGCGFVGATTAYALTKSGLFSEMVLIDLNHKKAEGEAADLLQGLPFLSPMEIYAGDYRDIADASIIIITAGLNQKPGQTRTELVRDNAAVFRSIVREIIRYNTEAILLVVTNPVDVLTYVTLRESGYPAERVIGSGTVLDTARLKQLVGGYLGVDSRNVHSFIIGEHGDSEVPVWSSANVSGIDLNRYCDCSGKGYDKAILHSLFDEVKNSAYQIIEAKNATYYAIAEAVKRIVAAIMRDENTILPVSTLAEGHYGLHNVCLGLPCVVGRKGIRQVLEIPLDEDEESKLQESARKLGTLIDSLETEETTV